MFLHSSPATQRTPPDRHVTPEPAATETDLCDAPQRSTIVAALAELITAGVAEHQLRQLLAGALANARAGGREIKSPSQKSGGTLTDWQLNQVRQHIVRNIGRSILNDELANAARLSRSHFSRSFFATTGETPHAFVTRQRIEKAMVMMAGTSETMCNIALACGFADQAHLCRIFRRYVGETPGGWRRTRQLGRERPLLEAL